MFDQSCDFRKVLAIVIITLLYSTSMPVIGRCQGAKAGLITVDNSRIRLACQGQKIFSDRDYMFGSLPEPLHNLHIIAGSFEKGVKIDAITPGELYAATPLKGETHSQEEALLAIGFRLKSVATPLYEEQKERVGLFVRKVQSADINSGTHEFKGWVIFFFSGSALPSITIPAQILTQFDSSYRKNARLWQGCPSIERTGQRFWATWFSGGRWEPDEGNYGIISYSKEGITGWVDPALIVKHPHPKVRVMDTQFWKDPSGKLWLFWTQNTGNHGFDGLWGTWAAVCHNPESSNPQWTAPRRLCDGLTRNKPTVLSTGEWLLPSYNWVIRQSTVYISTDKGATWTYQGGPYNNDETFYEHMLVERRDKSLWLLQRNIKESVSYDKGKTWTALSELKELPSASSRLFISRLRSGNLLLIYNHDPGKRDRKNLTAVLSADDGKTWPYRLLLDERSGVSYPDAVQDKKGFIYVVYDRSRAGEKEILLARFKEEDIQKGIFKTRGSKSKMLVSKPASAGRS